MLVNSLLAEFTISAMLRVAEEDVSVKSKIRREVLPEVGAISINGLRNFIWIDSY